VPGELYDYAVIRVVPRVDREEFLNVGVVLSCEAREFLDVSLALDERRLTALHPGVDVAAVARHLEGFARVARGAPDAGPVATQPRRARFHWLTATRSALVQTSPVHMGRTEDPSATLARLVECLVRTAGTP